MDNKLFIVTGKKGSGKTTILRNVVKILKERNIKVVGFMAIGFWENDKRSYFELENISTEEAILYCTRERVKEWEEVPPFFINPEAIKIGNQILSPEKLKNIDLLIIDELGPFELQEKGWASAIKKLIGLSDIKMIWVVRESLIEIIPSYFGLKIDDSFNVSESNKDDLLERIQQFFI